MFNFSVVITTRNRVEFLRRCVLSILENSILPKELIIINDAGVRVTHELLKPFNSDICLNIVNNEEVKGANYCRNLGVSLTNTGYVFFIDDDDAFVKEAFKKRMEIFMSDESLGLVYTGFHIVRSSNLKQIITSKTAMKPSISPTDSLLSGGNFIGSTSRVAVKKAAFLNAGGFDENLSSVQDYELWVRLSEITKISTDDYIGLIYTIHDGLKSQVSKNYLKYLDSTDYIIKKYNKSHFPKEKLNAFYANLYLRVAIAGADNFKIKFTYCMQSLKYRFRIKTVVFMMTPSRLIRLIKDFV